MWNGIVTLFQDYMGTGLLIGWFLLSLVYLLWKEKRTHIRILLVYTPIVLLLVFFNPLIAGVLQEFLGDEVTYRILWLIPVTVVIAYTAVQLYGALAGKARMVFAGICCVLVIISGSCIYTNPHFTKADNSYHIPQEVVDICDAIEVEGREVMAAFPREMLQYVRQYSPVVCMPYGREQLVDSWGYHFSELGVLLDQKEIDAARLSQLAKEQMCHYIILSQEKVLLGDLLDYEYVLFDTIDGYDIYLDTTIYIGL